MINGRVSVGRGGREEQKYDWGRGFGFMRGFTTECVLMRTNGLCRKKIKRTGRMRRLRRSWRMRDGV